ENNRPADSSIKGRRFAGLVYRLLARGYIGSRKLQEFHDAMEKVEAISSGDDAQSVTRIYERLGRELQREFERLKSQGELERLDEERQNFKWIVDELFKRKADLKYSTLIWIAESSYGIGEGVGDADGATDYFKQSAEAYQQVLDGGRISAKQRLAVQLRLANCRRRQEEFETATRIVEGVVKTNPNLLRAQVEAALAYQAWGGSGKTDMFLIAIAGDPKRGLWGWSGVAKKLRQNLDFLQAPGKTPDSEQIREYEERYLQARYFITWSRMQYGIAQSSNPKDRKRQQVLKNAVREMIDLAMTYGVIDGKQFEDPTTRRNVDAKQKFNALYRDIQVAMGRKQPATLTWAAPRIVPPVKPAPKGNGQPAAKTNIATAKTDAGKNAKKNPNEAGSAWGTIAAMIFAVAILAGGGWFLYGMTKGPRKPRYSYGSYGTGPTFPGSGPPVTGTASRKQNSSRKKQGGAKRTAASAGSSRRKPPPTPQASSPARAKGRPREDRG
ncbi:MAG: hypothetical protein ACE5KM_21120, partial [Planctomycetaceae bacterium]